MTGSPEEQAEEALREAVRRIAAYPQCSNGPDCQCPFHFGMERVRVACPVCGLTTEHGDRVHQYRYTTDTQWTRRSDGLLEPSGHYELRPGPDWDEPEQELRKRRRELADQHEAQIRAAAGIPPAQYDGGWQAGTCTGCGMTDAVKGPAGAELCKWCDELRILAPLPVTVIKPPVPARRDIRWKDWGVTGIMLAASVLAVCGLVEVSGLVMLFALALHFAR